MPNDRRDEEWATRRLSAEAQRCEFDRAAFRARVMAEVQASIDGDGSVAGSPGRVRRWTRRLRLVRGPVSGRAPGLVRPERRPRYVPAILAATAIVGIAVAGSVLPQVQAWSRDDRLGGGQAASSPTSDVRVSSTPTSHLGENPPSLSVPTSSAAPAPSDPGRKAATLPSSFRWTSGGPLISAKPDAEHAVDGLKDASVVYYQGAWHVFATASGGAAPGLVYLSFTDWAKAGSATQHFLDQSPLGTGYRAAPQVFYFAPQKLWYLVYQTGVAAYSTNPDISDPKGWSAPKDFFPGGVPELIRQNVGDRYWVDMWVICDDTDCYLFSSDQQGHLYRSRTSLANFPDGMSQPVIALQDPNRLNLLNSTDVYRVAGTGQYLLIMEAIRSDGTSYLRSWTATGLGGSWRPLAATEGEPFAGLGNVAFGGDAWAKGISHGELIRDGHDQTLTVSPCHLRYLYHGQGNQLGLLTQTNATCS